MTNKLVAVLSLTVLLAGCGNLYYHDLVDSYEPYRLHLGEPNETIGARSAAFAGAGRADEGSPAAVVNNPAGLAGLEGTSFEGGLAFENRSISWQADLSYPVAGASTNSFAGSYAAVGAPIWPGRIYAGAAYWTPYDMKLTLGESSSEQYTESGGGIHSFTPGVAIPIGPARLGTSVDILWGGQSFDTTVPSVDPFGVSFFGYDVRAGFQYRRRLNKDWAFAVAAVGRRGAQVDVSEGAEYSMGFAPQAGGALSAFYKNLSVHGDYLYNFAKKMTSTNTDDDYALERLTRDAAYLMAGAEYSFAGGTVRGGYALKPRLFRDGSRGAVGGRFYSFGGGWNAFGGRGTVDAALTYGRRGSMNDNRFYTSYIDVILTAGYSL